MLHETGLTPRLFAPDDYRDLLTLGIGLTDVNKSQSGADSDLTPDGDDVAADGDPTGTVAAGVVASIPDAHIERQRIGELWRLRAGDRGPTSNDD
jgi:hypothetical protein